MYDVGLGIQTTNEVTGLVVFQQFSVDGVPGDAGLSAGDLALSNAAPLGARAVDSSTGLWHRKKTAGSGATKWELDVTQDDLAGAGGGNSWREPVKVKDSSVYANLAAAEVAVNTGTVDGVATIAEDDRILFDLITGENKNVYIVTGTVGAGATLVEDGNAATNNDALFVNEGTSAGQQYNYNATLDQWNLANQTDLDELGYIRDYIGKSAAGAETPSYTNEVYVTDGDSLEVAIGLLDAQLSTNATAIGSNTTAIGNAQTEIDAIEAALGASVDANGDYVAHTGTNYLDTNSDVTEDILDLDAAIAGITNDDTHQNAFIGKDALGAETPTYSSAEVITQSNDLEGAIGELDVVLDNAYHASANAAVTTTTAVDSVLVDDVEAVKWYVHIKQGTKIAVYEMMVTHDGTTGGDAVNLDDNVSKLKLNGQIIGLTVDTALSGVTTAQVINLNVSATAAVEVKVVRTVVI